jgi:CheY-like chemotaxis protein
VILADVFLPTRSGFDLCRHVKSSPALRHIGVILTAGMLEPFDENDARGAGAVGVEFGHDGACRACLPGRYDHDHR